VLKSLGRSLLATAMEAGAHQITWLGCFRLPPCGVRWTNLYAACLYLDLTHSVYFFCDILCLRFSYILLTHATAPCSARKLTQARPIMSCIRLVFICETLTLANYIHWRACRAVHPGIKDLVHVHALIGSGALSR